VIGGFQVGPFQPAYQQEGVTAQRGGGIPRRLRDRRRRLTVEIDGQLFNVETPQEAEDLILKAREVAAEQARVEALRVVKKRRTISRRERKPLKLDAVSLPAPYVKPGNADSSDLAQRIQAQLDAVYAQAARDAEIALHMHHRLALDEEEAITLLLLE